jgi:hypothetical protein
MLGSSCGNKTADFSGVSSFCLIMPLLPDDYICQKAIEGTVKKQSLSC